MRLGNNNRGATKRVGLGTSARPTKRWIALSAALLMKGLVFFLIKSLGTAVIRANDNHRAT